MAPAENAGIEITASMVPTPGRNLSALAIVIVVLVAALAGNSEALSERTVDVQVNRLRRKIERDPANPLIVQTVRGIGYRLVPAL